MTTKQTQQTRTPAIAAQNEHRHHFHPMNLTLSIVSVGIAGIYVGASSTSGNWTPNGWILTIMVAVLVAWCVYIASRVAIRSYIEQLKADHDAALTAANAETARVTGLLAAEKKKSGSYEEIMSRLDTLAPVLEKVFDHMEGGTTAAPQVDEAK